MLDLGDNTIYAQGAKNLAKELGGSGGGGGSAGSGLERLHLEHNSIGDEGLEALAGALRHNRTLTALRLGSGNGIYGSGARALAKALSANRLSGVRELSFDETSTPMPIQAELLFALSCTSGGEATKGILFGRILYDQHERARGSGSSVSHRLRDMLDERECAEFYKRPLTYCVLRYAHLEQLADFLITHRNEHCNCTSTGQAYVRDDDAHAAVHAAIACIAHAPTEMHARVMNLVERMFEGGGKHQGGFCRERVPVVTATQVISPDEKMQVLANTNPKDQRPGATIPLDGISASDNATSNTAETDTLIEASNCCGDLVSVLRRSYMPLNFDPSPGGVEVVTGETHAP